MKPRAHNYLKLLCATASTLLMIDAASADSDDPKDTPFDPEANYENVIDAELANYNLLEVSTDDDIFFTPAFVDAFSHFKFGGDDKDLGKRFEDLYHNLDMGQIAREVAAMRDLFDLGIAFFDPLDESSFTSSGKGDYLGGILGQPTESTRGTSPPVGFGLGGIASLGGPTAAQHLSNRLGTNYTRWTSSNEDGSSYETVIGHDENGTAFGRTKSDRDGWAHHTVIIEEYNNGTRSETYTNHRHAESQTLTVHPDGRSMAIYRNPQGEVWVNKSSDGTVTKTVTPQGGEPIVSEDTPPSETDTTGNPGDEPTADEREFADWLFGQHALGRHTPGGSVKSPDRVNPGDPSYGGNEAPRLNPGISIVINPNINESTGSGRELSAELGKAVQQQLSEKVGGKINPPSPNE